MNNHKKIVSILPFSGVIENRNLLPKILIDDNPFKVTLDVFTEEEASYHSGITITSKDETGTKYDNQKRNHPPAKDLWEISESNVKLEIEYLQDLNSTNDHSSFDLVTVIKKIGLFAFGVIWRNVLTLNSGRSSSSIEHINFNTPTIGIDFIVKFQAFYMFIKNNKEVKRIEQIESLLRVSMQRSIPKGLKGSLLVTILESMFSANDEKTEIRYRFPLRMAKYLGENLEFSKKIKSVYDSRSSYYHTGEDKFTSEQIKFLENTTIQIIGDYIQKPEIFKGPWFDELLLS